MKRSLVFSILLFSSISLHWSLRTAFFFLFVFFFFFSFIFISWRLITLQYCSGFCHTLTWVSHGFTCVPHPDPPSLLPPHPIPLGLPSAPGPALVSCIQPGLVICFTLDNINVLMLFPQNIPPSSSPTEKDSFLISPCYSLELCIQMGISFLYSFAFSLLFFSQMFVRPPQGYSSNHLIVVNRQGLLVDMLKFSLRTRIRLNSLHKI